jgi:hypothetical protein
MLNVRPLSVLFTLIIACGVTAMALRAADKPAAEEKKTRYFEMRTYHAAPDKLDALNARFRDHTVGLFKKHGMESIGYWTPAVTEESAKPDTLVYILAYPSKEAAEASWKAFRADPDWIKAKAESEVNGPLVEKVDSLPLNPTDYSAIK